VGRLESPESRVIARHRTWSEEQKPRACEVLHGYRRRGACAPGGSRKH